MIDQRRKTNAEVGYLKSDKAEKKSDKEFVSWHRVGLKKVFNELVNDKVYLPNSMVKHES